MSANIAHEIAEELQDSEEARPSKYGRSKGSTKYDQPKHTEQNTDNYLQWSRQVRLKG
jgi:hypothetical protein